MIYQITIFKAPHLEYILTNIYLVISLTQSAFFLIYLSQIIQLDFLGLTFFRQICKKEWFLPYELKLLSLSSNELSSGQSEEF